MDVYPPGGEDVDLPAGRVFLVVIFYRVNLFCANLYHGLATSVMGS